MYHRIRNEHPDNRYNVVPEVFRSQMQTLADLGYTTLTTAQLARILLHGGAIPPRPIVITFDDGYLDVYETAWPIMQAHGFVGSFYVVSSYVGGTGFANAEQLKEMAAAGWEIGSHSQSHLDLPADHNEVYAQLAGSKTELEKMLGVSIDTVAYPFGKIDAYVVEKTIKYGYLAGVGLGNLNTQSTGSLYYLSRREVRASYTHSDFLALLPWTEPLP